MLELYPYLTPDDFRRCATLFVTHQERLQRLLSSSGSTSKGSEGGRGIVQFRVRRAPKLVFPGLAKPGADAGAGVEVGGDARMAEENVSNGEEEQKEDNTEEIYLAMISSGQSVQPHSNNFNHANNNDPEDEDEDPDSLPPPRPPVLTHPHAPTQIHILYSASYRVPVVYFQFPDDSLDSISRSTPPISAVVAATDKISQSEHPFTGEIWWYIHPCATGEAMDALRDMVLSGAGDDVGIGGDDEAGAGPEERYMAAWWGLVETAVMGK